VHLLSVDSSMARFEKLRDKYLPSRITHDHYPELIAEGEEVPTIANATILAVYGWPKNSDRYRRVANFVNRFFSNIDKLMLDPYHPRWREINLAADVPGWKRFKAAQDWLDQHGDRLKTASAVRPEFQKFLQRFLRSRNKGNLSPEESETLTIEFMKWWESQKTTTAR
jgi:uncharacterized protein